MLIKILLNLELRIYLGYEIECNYSVQKHLFIFERKSRIESFDIERDLMGEIC